MLATLLAVLVRAATGEDMGVIAFFVALIAVPAIVVARRFESLRMLRAQSERSMDARLRDHPYELDEYPTLLAVLVDGKSIGTDRGIVVFSEGLLAFHGTATSFALCAEDVHLSSQFGRDDPYSGLPRDALALRTNGRDVAIQLVGLRGHEEALIHAVSHFLSRSTPTTEPRQWPPAYPYRPPLPAAPKRVPLPRLIQGLPSGELLDLAHGDAVDGKAP